jgi:tRNA A-37 threonylcarbamoyl transferase component Bud32
MRTLSKTEYDKLLARSEIIQKDRSGVKVLRQPDGDFLKTFWCRESASFRRIYPEWFRFVQHAEALQRRGILTVTVKEALRIPHLKRTAVIYRPLEGRTLRQVAAAGEFDAALAARLGRMIAGLHSKGVYFHSLHLGNVLLCPDGTFGLIDISNMRIFPWSLSAGVRMRNLTHLFRYPEDRQILTQAGIEGFTQGFLEIGEIPDFRCRLQELLGEIRMLKTLAAENSGWIIRAGAEWRRTEIFKACHAAFSVPDERFQPVDSSLSTAVFRFEWQGRSYYLKHYLFKNWPKHLRSRAKIRRLSGMVELMNRAGFHSPEIVCSAHKRKKMFSVSVAADADCSVHDLYTKNGAGIVADMARFRELFGREIGRLHAAGFVHGDLRWGNVLVKNPDSEHPEFVYLDNDRTRRYRKIPAAGRIKNLVQIHFVEVLRQHPASHWDEFWKGYCAANPDAAERESFWRNRVERKAMVRVKRQMEKTAAE